MAKKLFTLQIKEDFDFLLLGIFCAYRDYRLCFEINQKLELSMERQNDLEMKMEKKGSTSLFPVFSCSNSDEEHYFIIGNKGSNGYFSGEHKQVDFFLMIRNNSRYTTTAKLSQKIREISIVSSVLEIEPSGLKNADNFLLIEPE